MKKIKFPFLIMFFSLLNLYSESSIDSLEFRLKNSILQSEEKIEILNKLAKAYWDVLPEKSIEFAEQALHLAEESKNIKGKADALNNIGGGYIYSDEYRKALEYFQKSKKIREEIGNKRDISHSLNNIGNCFLGLNNYKDALENYLMMLKIHEEIDDKSEIAVSSSIIGDVYQTLSSYENALEHYLRSLRLFEELQDKNGISSVLISIGVVYSELRYNDNSLKCFQKALVIFEKFQDKINIANALNNIGNVYSDDGDENKALEYYLKALEIAEELDDKNGIASYLNNIGIVYSNQGNHEKALENYHKSLKISENIGDEYGVVLILNNIGSSYLELKNLEKASTFLEKAGRMAQEKQIKNLIMTTDYNFSDLYKRRNNYQKAYEYFKLYAELKDSIFSEEKLDKIAKLEIKQAVEKKEQEIEILKKDKEIHELIVSRQRFQRNSLLIGFILILILFFVIFNRYRIKIRANREIKNKNMQLTEAYKKMDKLSRIDTLTGLPNRRHILEKIEDEKTRFERFRETFVLIISDIDNFKNFNDKYGHDCGDFVLSSAAGLLKNIIRKIDIVARWGGEEFLFLLPNTDLKGGKIIAEKIRKKLDTSFFRFKDIELKITMTFGVSVFTKSMDIDDCIKNADQALYQGKNGGKNCVVGN